MPLSKNKSDSVSRAELAFRLAFERLRNSRPEVVDKGSKVTQNNIAREAGLDPSALKKSRFPELVAEIQTWIKNRDHSDAPSTVEKKATRKSHIAQLKSKISQLRQQRDNVAQLLCEADALILELQSENNRLQSLVPKTKIKSVKR